MEQRGGLTLPLPPLRSPLPPISLQLVTLRDFFLSLGSAAGGVPFLGASSTHRLKAREGPREREKAEPHAREVELILRGRGHPAASTIQASWRHTTNNSGKQGIRPAEWRAAWQRTFFWPPIALPPPAAVLAPPVALPQSVNYRSSRATQKKKERRKTERKRKTPSTTKTGRRGRLI